MVEENIHGNGLISLTVPKSVNQLFYNIKTINTHQTNAKLQINHKFNIMHFIYRFTHLCIEWILLFRNELPQIALTSYSAVIHFIFTDMSSNLWRLMVLLQVT